MNSRFQINEKNHEPLQGRLLVASRALEGTGFSRTVILILQENEQGTFGVILNRPADARAIEAWQKKSNSPEHVIQHLSCGGPLGGPVFAVHRDGDIGEIRVADDLFVSASTESLGRLFVGPDQHYRVFLGIAGWNEKQLQNETDRGLWYVIDDCEDDVVGPPDHLWERCLIRYGKSQLRGILGVSSLPDQSAWN